MRVPAPDRPPPVPKSGVRITLRAAVAFPFGDGSCAAVFAAVALRRTRSRMHQRRKLHSATRAPAGSTWHRIDRGIQRPNASRYRDRSMKSRMRAREAVPHRVADGMELLAGVEPARQSTTCRSHCRTSGSAWRRAAPGGAACQTSGRNARCGWRRFDAADHDGHVAIRLTQPLQIRSPSGGRVACQPRHPAWASSLRMRLSEV